MLRQKTLALVLAAACSSTMYAAPFGNIFHKDKDTSTAHSSSANVNVTFNNTAQFPRQIKVGDKVKTLSSHKVTRMSIPAGTTVTVYSSMKTHNPGDVLLVVDAAHPDAVVPID